MKKYLTIIIEHEWKGHPFNEVGQRVYNGGLDAFRIVGLADGDVIQEIEKLEKKLERKE